MQSHPDHPRSDNLSPPTPRNIAAMSLTRLLAIGTIGFIAYRAWQRHQETSAPYQQRDDGSRTTPHGDPILAGEQIDIGDETIRPAAHASRGFGGE